MKNIIIWGASGHAKVILSALPDTHYRLCGLIDQNPTITQFKNHPVYPSAEALLKNTSLNIKETYFILAIGGSKGFERMEIHHQLIDLGLKPLTIHHPTAWIDPTATLGLGSQILGMSAISADVSIGSQSIINTNATIDHETIIGDGCHIMPAATIAGCVLIGDYCTIGSNATVLPRVKLAPYTIVGAGAVVTKDTLPNSTVVGVPAKQIL